MTVGWSKPLKLVVLLMTAKAQIYETNMCEKLQKCDWHGGKGHFEAIMRGGSSY